MNRTFFIGVYPGLKEEQLLYVRDRFAEFMSQHS
jgi:hypothetical protein